MKNHTKGVLCIVASAFGFALMAAFVRLCDECGGPISSFQKSFFRNVVALMVAVAVFVRGKLCGGKANVLRSTGIASVGWCVMVLRAVLGTAGIFANFYALSRIPIAEGQTLNKTAPFFTVLFLWFFLGERATWRQTVTLVVAFAGVLLVVKPGFAGEAAFPLGIGLFSGVCAGGAYACVRKLGLMQVNGSVIVAFFSLFSCLASVPFMLLHTDTMTGCQIVVLIGAGTSAALGQFGITAAYRYAAPRQIAVFDYVNILFTAILGFLLFGQVPDVWSVMGFAIVVFAALRMRGDTPRDAQECFASLTPTADKERAATACFASHNTAASR